MTAFRAAVLEHFRHPKNRRRIDGATVSVEGANPLCGDRIRVEMKVERGSISDAAFTADACAVCVAAASVLTEHVHGASMTDAEAIDIVWVYGALGGEPPRGRARCAQLPLETLKRAIAESRAIVADA
ncbi:MAG: iron-sulfur cluster assembly scaffold protein [Gemmatimonadaceae bacterium]